MTLEITTSLPPLNYRIPATMVETLSYGGSGRGFHAVSEYLECPEKYRLHTLGVVRKPKLYADAEMNALQFGTLIHALAAIRQVHGMEIALRWLNNFLSTGEIIPSDHLKATFMLRVYDQQYPIEEEPFEYLGIELLVYSNLADRGEEEINLRTVRYDGVVRYPDGAVFSLERKTSSRSGLGALQPHYPQTMTQQAVWNANPNLVQRYGEMRGVLFEQWVKTTEPKIERVGPMYWGKVHERLAVEYMRLPETQVNFKKNPDGTSPKFLHACYGRWSPCDFLDLCWEQSFGSYQMRDGSPLEVE